MNISGDIVIYKLSKLLEFRDIVNLIQSTNGMHKLSAQLLETVTKVYITPGIRFNQLVIKCPNIVDMTIAEKCHITQYHCDKISKLKLRRLTYLGKLDSFYEIPTINLPHLEYVHLYSCNEIIVNPETKHKFEEIYDLPGGIFRLIFNDGKSDRVIRKESILEHKNKSRRQRKRRNKFYDDNKRNIIESANRVIYKHSWKNDTDWSRVYPKTKRR